VNGNSLTLETRKLTIYPQDPKLRDEVKEDVKASDKGGAPGQWSARKAQFMAQEYKKRGGDYNTDKSEKDESQKSLSKWNEEDWQTKDGEGEARQADGSRKRYLPKKAWENMTEEEKEKTDEKKQKGSKEGKQHVANTGKARESRARASKSKDKKDEGEKAEEIDKNKQADDGDDNEAEPEEQEGDDEDEKAEEDPKPGQKRKSQRQSTSASKKQKSTTATNNNKNSNAPPGKIGSKHMDASEPAPRGSSDRLPKKGQKIVWKAMPGYVDGEVTEVLTKGKKVNGKQVKASEEDPKIVMKSTKSGKICVHKPGALRDLGSCSVRRELTLCCRCVFLRLSLSGLIAGHV
jgi:hypothetical protein